MFLKISVLLALTEALSVIAAPSTASKEPCALVTQQVEESAALNGTVPYVSPYLAHQCLLSLPFDPRRAAAFVTEVKKNLQWHSTIDTLKNPPSGYLSPAVDLLGELDHLHQKALKQEFSSQFEFDTALQRLLASANDGHLVYSGCSQRIFQFTVPTQIASVSSDGLEIPEIYDFSDVYLLAEHSDLVSPIVSINGEKAESYLKNISHHQAYQDPDARYNKVFDSLTRYPENMNMLGSWSADPAFLAGHVEFDVKWANGTGKKVHVQSMPTAKYRFNYTDSRTLFQDYCIIPPDSFGQEGDAEADLTTAAAWPALPASPFLPKAVMRDPYNLISGYFPEDPEWKDLAVLLVPSFATSEKGNDEPLAFANSATQFIQEAKKAGKKKLIIDLSNNGGGFIASGMDLFKLFFPDKDIYTAARLRAHEALNLYGKAMSKLPQGSELAGRFPFTIPNLVTPNQTYTFQSWEEFYGPHKLAQSNQTSLFSNLKLSASNWYSVIRGYGIVKQNETSSPFAAEDILLLTDGLCTSTCTIFSELMKTVGGVKSITFGGRPQQGPMQAIGGSKGCAVGTARSLFQLREAANRAALQAEADGKPVLSHQEHARLNASIPDRFSLKFNTLAFNIQNAYREGDDEMPLQFLYEAADCRLFYTPDNLVLPATTWISAANAFWGNGACISGSYSTSKRAGRFV
ncbi:uncharacterized protein LDX57_006789 [Aspergillus melleus]|uniref:uncharacterized protein n=1 Tax=Aspergillus melleus TaxID=138277 RepID=UPI001E8EB43B|nr:uncharacterized protein LDX57_006789 [Aspergillus melleus]KAH8429119.1 hypothetical protein LDX57_006789 [Aspergillus melleus]